MTHEHKYVLIRRGGVVDGQRKRTKIAKISGIAKNRTSHLMGRIYSVSSGKWTKNECLIHPYSIVFGWDYMPSKSQIASAKKMIRKA